VNFYKEREKSLDEESKEEESQELNYSGGEDSDEEKKENVDLTDARLNEILPEDNMEARPYDQMSDNNLKAPNSHMDDLKMETIDQNEESNQDENMAGEDNKQENIKGKFR
jgi:hypothetical protein